MRGRFLECPTCGALHRNAEYMEPAELRAINGIVGVKKGWQGPLPQHRWARLLGISPRTLSNYLSGAHPIPNRIAREARRMKEAEPEEIDVPRRWEAHRKATEERRFRHELRRARRARKSSDE